MLRGIVHLCDFDWTIKEEELLPYYTVGQQIQTMILTIEPEMGRVCLGIKQLKPRSDAGSGTDPQTPKRYKLRFLSPLLIALMVPTVVEAGTYVLPDAKFRVEMVALAEIEAGDSFTIYAKVNSYGDQSLKYPAIRRAGKGKEEAVAGYRFLPCQFDCIG